jgi:uncharacterized protein YndB with AHSA1/START domain
MTVQSTSVLPQRLDRTVVINASPRTVFSFFTENDRWASWWGAGSTIDPRPGGRVRILYPGAVEVLGEVLEIAPPERIVFTYGFASGKPIPPGSSRVAIHLEPHGKGTRLTLLHEFEEEMTEVRDHHIQGWRYQLSLFANVVADLVNAGAATIVDTWFDAWAEPDADTRARMLAEIATPEIRFRDRYSFTDGADDLLPHIAAAQRFMPGIRSKRQGDIRHCQGVVLADWIARNAEGQEKGAGTNVFVLNAEGRIESVTGLWAPPAAAK